MNILLIGGGTGSTVVIEGLKKHKDLNLSVIVGMMDDGGSNAVVRDEFGLLPLSDIRKSLLALYENGNDEVLRKLFLYRFSTGEGIKGHTLGNLLMVAMSDILGSEVEAIEMFKTIFGIKGDVIPVTLDKSRLVAEYENGEVIEGEHLIDEPEDDRNISKFYLNPPAKANPDALRAIEKADFIILGPGDLYTTTLANMVVDGMKESIQKSRAKIICIGNLMSKKGQTRNITQSDYLHIMEKYLGKEIDCFLINNGKIPQNAYTRYVEKGEHIIEDDITKELTKGLVVRADLVATARVVKDKGDKLERSLVRHDSKKLDRELNKIFYSESSILGKSIRRFLSYYKD